MDYSSGMDITSAATFSATAVALYVGHHAGDYWVQTDHDAACKGLPGWKGRLACMRHVGTYTLTQLVILAITALTLDMDIRPWAVVAGLLVSAVTHYLADRREYGLMIRLARLIPGKANFLKLGVPRQGKDDNPSLGTGGWALDQSWHIVLGVWVPALIVAVL